MPYVIGRACVDLKDRTCIEECPVDCIYEGGRMMYIHPDECVDCGACEPVCPVGAIAYEDDLTEEDEPFADVAQQVFSELGSLGGSARFGVVPDPPFVAALESNVTAGATTDE
jgi:NAD-dependent dihydropyrimidine dehydrogenase PreA subunit